MAVKFREMLQRPAVKAVVVLVGCAAVGIAVWQVIGAFGSSQAARASTDRIYICAEAKKPFAHRLQLGERAPVRSPHSGKDTGYPAELCFWNADGTVRTDPVPVLLNQYIGNSEPTFCPECGRLVVGHNPAPDPARRPPPTKAEYAGRKQPQQAEERGN